MKCCVCGSDGNGRIIKHHLSYKDNITFNVCEK